MKKVLLSLGIALGTVAVYASAQVYDVSITLNTTGADKAKVSSLRKHMFAEQFSATDEEGKTLYFRKTAKKTLTGLIWGCNCATIVGDAGDELYGSVIWDEKAKAVVFRNEFNWRFIQAIGKDGTALETTWSIGDPDGDAFFVAGGTGSLATVKQKGEDPDECDGVYVSQLQGSFGGWLPAPKYTIKGKEVKCSYCEGKGEESPDTYILTDAWEFCPCLEMTDREHTTAHGTWKIKYNASLSKKLTDAADISRIYKFPSYVNP